MPISARPPERWSIVTAALASMPGLRNSAQKTRQPTRMFEVAPASAASEATPSKHGSSRDCSGLA